MRRRPNTKTLSNESAAVELPLGIPQASRRLSAVGHTLAVVAILGVAGPSPWALALVFSVIVIALVADHDLRRLRYRQLLWHTAGSVSLLTKEGQVIPAQMLAPVWKGRSSALLRVQPEGDRVCRLVVERGVVGHHCFRRLMMRLTVEYV